MLDLEILAIEKLMVFYSQYYNLESIVDFQKEAKMLYDELSPLIGKINQEIGDAIEMLAFVAFPSKGLISKEDVKTILYSLRNLRLYLER